MPSRVEYEGFATFMFGGRYFSPRGPFYVQRGVFMFKGKWSWVSRVSTHAGFLRPLAFSCSNDDVWIQRNVLCSNGYFMLKGELWYFLCFYSCRPLVGKRFGNVPELQHFAKIIPIITPAWTRWFEKPSQLWAKACLCEMCQNVSNEMNGIPKKSWNICSTYWMNILKPFWNIGKRSAVFIFKCVFKFKGNFVWTSLCSTSSLSISYGQVRASPVFSSAVALHRVSEVVNWGCLGAGTRGISAPF